MIYIFQIYDMKLNRPRKFVIIQLHMLLSLFYIYINVLIGSNDYRQSSEVISMVNLMASSLKYERNAYTLYLISCVNNYTPVKAFWTVECKIQFEFESQILK